MTGGIDYVVLDFDGTFTEVEAEGAPFTTAYREYLGDLVGKDEDLVRDLWTLAERRVRSEPDRFGGYEEQGRIVAPPSDPYLRANAIARILCQRFQILRNPQLRNDVLTSIFRMAYAQSATCFREGAAQVLDEVLARKRVTIVTNSSPAIVLSKLARLGLANRTPENPRVIGEAHKFGVAARPLAPLSPMPPAALDAWSARYAKVPEELVVTSARRPIYQRRASYFRVLRDEVWGEDLEGPERTLVVGDIYELDLALPAALGAHVHLVTREGTPAFEVSIVESLVRGRATGDLRGILERIV